MSRCIRAVMFDLDGTLLDTAPDFIYVVNRLRAEKNLPDADPDTIRASVSNGSKAVIQAAFGVSDADSEFEPLRQRLLELYLANIAIATAPFPGIQTLLEQLHQHQIPWGIATNKPWVYTQPLLAALKLTPAPACVICPEHVNVSKPDPACLHLAATQLGISTQQILYVGDHLRDIECGRAAGCRTLAVSFGYLAADEDANSWGADDICHHASEIWPLIEPHLVTA